MRETAASNSAADAVTISALPVQPSLWQPSLGASGSIVAVHQVRLAAPLAGVVRKIAFDSGALVRAGDTLVQLDNEENKAQLNVAEADAELARIKLKRYRDLGPRGAVSQSQMDQLEAEAKRTAAEVDSARASYEKKTIRAPFTGHVSIRDVNLGQFLAPGDAVVELQSLDPVYVDFSIPQDRLDDARPGGEVRVSAGPAGASPRVGRISSVNPAVDPVSRNLRVRATLRNTDLSLRPGMFVRVELAGGAARPVILVPVTALRRSAFATSVFVISRAKDPEDGVRLIANERLVHLGPADGNRFVVQSGLDAGETVAVAGVFKLREGANVLIDNHVLPPGVPPAKSPATTP